jgi:phosphopantothenate-cysteine ligase
VLPQSVIVNGLILLSPGTRGATSAEYFLKQGYAVIFMHRQFSLQPFSRNYSHSTHPFLDFLEIDVASHSSFTIDSAYPYSNDPSPGAAQSYITVKTSERAALLSVLRAYKAVQAEGTLHTLTFVTVNDYLYLLRAISKEMKRLGPNAMYYLAAAVSDFFLPRQKMVSTTIHTFRLSLNRRDVVQSEHKIQSGKGSLHIEMDQVPKVLKPLVSEWVPAGFVVSFKVCVAARRLIDYLHVG